MTRPSADLPVLGSPATVAAAIPYLLGFRPESSIVILILEGRPGAIRVTFRIDLPTPDLPAPDLPAPDLPAPDLPAPDPAGPATAPVSDWVRGVLDVADRAGAPGRRLLVVGFGPQDPTPALDALMPPLTEMTCEVLDVLVVQEAPGRQFTWRSRLTGQDCCDQPHPLRDSDRTRARRLLTRAGITVGHEPGTRADVEAEIAPRPHDLIDAADIPGPSPQAREVAVAQVRDALSRPRPSRREIALAVAALRDVHVRDTVIYDLLHEPSQRWSELASNLARWIPRLPAGDVAGAATVLAILRWQTGDGTRGSVALDRALAANPDYRLAVLIRAVIDTGQPPSEWLDGLRGMSREVCLGHAA